MNEKPNTTSTSRKTISYTFNNPIISQPAAPAATAKPKRPAPPPPIGPEIGPDPRSSIGARISMSEIPTMKAECGILFDFAYGYRVKFPAGNKQYKLRVYDMDSGMPLEEHTHKGGDFIVGQNKYFVRYRLEAYVDEKLVFEHDYNCEDQEVCIIIPDGGLGDNLA